MCVGLLRADIVTNSFHKVGDCSAASVAPAFVGKVKSRSRIHCSTQCSKISECNSVIYQAATKTCLFYDANEGTCPSTNGREVDVYKKNAVVSTLSSVSSDSPTTSYSNIGSTEQVMEETSQTLQSNGIQNLHTDISTSTSTQSTSNSTISSVTNYDPSCVHGNYYMDNGRSLCICNDGFMGTDCRERFTRCTDWSNYLSTLKNWDVSSDYYTTQYSRQVTIQPPNSPQPFSVQCKFTSFTAETYVYMNTEKDRNNFDKTWSKMKEGFVFNGGFWIGMDRLYELITNERSFGEQTMIVTWVESNSRKYTVMVVNNLQIGNETTNYQVQYTNGRLGYFSSFPDLNGAMFSTKDNDNDGVSDLNCANKNKRAFWYNGECSFDTLILFHIKLRKYSTWP
ncbi:hypothetical protein LOTGIDRAFT_160146 [Lottia gigantea]|uniref:Fibrinogen C-terminal domain-containing protein n=1 Tax=Lottia gigantea TaxID=225164 RepID=V4C3N8_LOTGI|nr:hypothetical protein LOTGIDRAFT_160146 [Lottia gigantea]ESO96159.1 hypothetical protein LOTGIDRAFT_160146 [Lottia gigantea]